MDLQLRELSDGVQCPISPQFDDLHVCRGEHRGRMQTGVPGIVDAFTCARVANTEPLGLYDNIHHHHTRP